MKDFTLKIYKQLLLALREQDYIFLTFEQWCEGKTPEKYVILRHDVDEMAKNALEMAKLENRLGVKATYSFRIVKQSNCPDIIKKIAALGHEIAYHYEDLVLADGDEKKALETFQLNLAYFRTFYAVKTVSMHGSSTSVHDNRDLWKNNSFYNEGIIGEPYLTVDYSDIFYLTDTGRSWDGFDVNMRDIVKSGFPNTYHHTNDIIAALEKNEFPSKVMMLAHTLWTDKKILWSYIYVREKLRNKIKLISRHNTFVRKIYSNFVKFYWK